MLFTVQPIISVHSIYPCPYYSQFSQWSINKTGKKITDLGVHSGACGPFIMTGAGGYRQVQTPKGKLFAFDTEGQYVLTCSQSGGLIYKVNMSKSITVVPCLVGRHIWREISTL